MFVFDNWIKTTDFLEEEVKAEDQRTHGVLGQAPRPSGDTYQTALPYHAQEYASMKRVFFHFLVVFVDHNKTQNPEFLLYSLFVGTFARGSFPWERQHLRTQ